MVQTEITEAQKKADRCLEVFQERVTYAMQCRGFSQLELAKRFGCAKSVVQSWASGRCMPSAYNLVKAAYVLDVSTDWLLGYSDDGGPEES